MAGEDHPTEVRLTLTDVYQLMVKQGEDFVKGLAEINKTLVATNSQLTVVTTEAKPQMGQIKEIFARLLGVERKVWALPSLATLIALAGLVIGISKP